MTGVVVTKTSPVATTWSQRLFDLVVAVLLLILFAPVIALTILAVRLDSPGPVIFRQPRVGLGGRQFTIYKFRTMFMDSDDRAHRAQNELEILGLAKPRDGVAFKDANDPRVTRVGRILRRLSIDELLQLGNVLRGDMSMVGPRPSLVWEAELFPPSAAARMTVRPGITGIWQVSGRNNVSMDEMLDMDCRYAETRTIRGDLLILLRTIPAALSGTGAA